MAGLLRARVLLLALFSSAAVASASAKVEQEAVADFQARVQAAEARTLHQKVLRHRACRDRPICKSLGKALRNPNEVECRYPTAEMCPRSCGRCHKVKSAERCQLVRTAATAEFLEKRVDWGEYFRRMLERADGLVHRGGGRMLSNGSLWMAEFPHFFSDEEADHLAEIAERLEPQPEDEIPHDIRNVDKIDCESEECLLDPLVNEVYRRTSELVGLPMGNFESMEFLRYTKGQHYLPHTDSDQGSFLKMSPEVFGSGLRVMTVFFYFTAVAKGGETGFPKAGLQVAPAKGKAVVWANVESNWWKTTEFSLHTSIPVKRGKKLAANFWVHPFEYRLAEDYAEHCYGSPRE